LAEKSGDETTAPVRLVLVFLSVHRGGQQAADRCAQKERIASTTLVVTPLRVNESLVATPWALRNPVLHHFGGSYKGAIAKPAKSFYFFTAPARVSPCMVPLVSQNAYFGSTRASPEWGRPGNSSPAP
jgi:hypothetical protein